MTKFEDRLFADLVAEHRLELRYPERPAPSARHLSARPVTWLAAAATTGAATVAGVILIGGSAPAYAVTQHPDGTVTVSLGSPAALKAANLRLRSLGDPVILVPVGSGCAPISSLPKPPVVPSGMVTTSGSESGGTLTVDARGVPAQDTMLIAASARPDGGMQLAGVLTSGPAPSCVSLPAPPAGGGPGSASGRSRSTSGPGDAGRGVTSNG